MGDKRQKNQLLLAFAEADKGEARKSLGVGTESFTVKRGTESPAIGEQLMEEVCEREKLQAGIGTSQGQQGERRGGRDDRSAVAGVPETALADNPGTTTERNL